MSPQEGVAVPRAPVNLRPRRRAEPELGGGSCCLNAFAPTNSESRALEPLPNFSACLCGSRSPRRDHEQPPGRVWPRWSQSGLPKPDEMFGFGARVRPCRRARQSAELAAGGLSGNASIAGIRRWGIGEPAGEELPETRVEPGGAMRQISGNQRRRLGRVCEGRGTRV